MQGQKLTLTLTLSGRRVLVPSRSTKKTLSDRLSLAGSMLGIIFRPGADPWTINPKLYHHYSLSLRGITKGGNSASALPVPFQCPLENAGKPNLFRINELINAR